jgi:hypothetical protein
MITYNIVMEKDPYKVYSKLIIYQSYDNNST